MNEWLKELASGRYKHTERRGDFKRAQRGTDLASPKSNATIIF